jgi:hypothetical protein
VAGADEDGVDGVAAGAGEAASFEEAAGLGVADNRFDGGSSAKLAPDGRRPLARALRNVDFRTRRACGRDIPLSTQARATVTSVSRST